MDAVRRIGILVTAIAIFATGCALNEGEIVDPGATIMFPGTSARLIVRVADSLAEQQRGLMGVDDLGPNQGMAFVYDEPTTSSFWMKDTLIPLSIAFVAEDGRIVAIEEMSPCEEQDPCPTWDSGGRPYTLAIEANAGWFAEHGVAVGDRARLGDLGHV
jgi:uncharacterized membrane protein (UPF0127 family)